MKAIYTPPAKTLIPFEDAAACMNTALASVLHASPSLEVLALALAKTALETGRWTAIWNNNWGNIKAGASYEGFYTTITLNEVLGHSVVWFAPEGQLNRKGGDVIGARWEVPPGHPQTRMRAYSDSLAGAMAYVEFVASGRYRDAFAELLEGDAIGYVRALRMKGYFTAPEVDYARGVLSLQKEFIAKLERRPAPDMGIPEPEEIRGLLAQHPANVEAVVSWGKALDSAREATRRSAREQMAIDPNALQDPDDDEITADETPHGNA